MFSRTQDMEFVPTSMELFAEIGALYRECHMLTKTLSSVWSKALHRPSLSRSCGVLELSSGSAPQSDSDVSFQPSLSSSGSALSPIPSMSLSDVSLTSFGNESLELSNPSPSMSSSALSPIPSPSRSDVSLTSFGNESLELSTPSPSMSSSLKSHIPSPSRSCGVLDGSKGSVPQSVSAVSFQPSPSVSGSPE